MVFQSYHAGVVFAKRRIRLKHLSLKLPNRLPNSDYKNLEYAISQINFFFFAVSNKEQTLCFYPGP